MRSIQTKVIALLLCCVMLCSIAIGCMSIVVVSDVLHKDAEENLRLTCQINSEKLNTLLSKVEESVNTLAHYATEELGSIEDLKNEDTRNVYLDKIEKVGLNHVESAESAMGVYARLNPEIVPDMTGYFWLKKAEDEEMKKQPLTDLTMYDKDDIANVGWWYLPVEKGQPVWMDSYHNENVGMHMISYVVPVYKEGQLIAVVGMDVACELIANAAKQIKLYDSGFATILNPDGTIMYHPFYEYGTVVGKSDKNFDEIKEAFFNQETTSEFLPYSVRDGQGKLYFSTLKNGMRLVITAPDSEIYARQNSLIRNILLFVVFIVIIAFVIAVQFANRLIEPIKKLNNVARQMMEGNLDVDIVPTTKDEVGELMESFNDMSKKLKNQMDYLDVEAHQDGLTGVNNKTAFLEAEMSINERIKGGEHSFALAVFDVNRLKVTNDVLGHMVGDNLLRIVANHLSSAFERKNVYRIGGDEFVVLLYEENFENYEQKLTECVEQMKKLSLDNYPDIEVSCAYGVEEFDVERDKDFSCVLAKADIKMYKNKALTKDRSLEWQAGSKGIKQLQIEKYLEFLGILSQSTEDYLFLFEFESNTSWFFGNVSEKYALCDNETKTNTIEQMLQIVHSGDRDKFGEDIRKLQDGESVEHNMNYRLMNRKGESVWVSSRGRVINDDTGVPFVMIGRVSESALKLLYNTTTGLFNKNKFLKDSKKGMFTGCESMLLMKIDNFSSDYLKLGSSYSEEMLCKLADALERKFSLHTVYHMEQDCFAVLLHTTSKDEIEKLFEDIQKEFDGEFTVSASVVPNDKKMYLDEENIYEYAKQLLRENKRDSQILYFSEEDLTKRLSKVEIMEEIEQSVRNNFEGFYLCYQPKINAKDYSVTSAEALLRYESKSKGHIFPDEFIPLLEHSGLINEVGMWVLETALKQCRKWREIVSDFGISVNFSSVQLRREDIAERILEMLGRYNLPASCLTVEITETVQLEDTEAYSEIFNRFRKAGIMIAIDDFGTGYSNLGYLKKIHADEIKIDRIFIKDISETTYNYRVVSNIIEFARTNNFKVCLEGVETAKELATIESLYPDTMQGYLFEKPVSPEDFERIYVQNDSREFKEKQGFVKDLHKYRQEMHIVRFNTKEILSQINVGLWVIRYNENDKTGELFADATMYKLLGIDSELSPGECYNIWYSKIKPGHEKTVEDMLNAMKQTDKVIQAEYPWIHTKRGEMMVRCTGKCVSKSDEVTIFEGFRRIISDMGGSYNGQGI